MRPLDAHFTSRSHLLRGTVFLALAGACLFGGCEAGAIYDGASLIGAKRVAVMPGSGAPGIEGLHAGRVQTGICMGELAEMKQFAVEGPGRFRKALSQSSSDAGGIWSRELQARLAEELDIDLLVLGDVIDYRFWKVWKKIDWWVGETRYTQTTWLVTVRIRMIHPIDGRLVYCAEGQAASNQGYGPAMILANKQALVPLRDYLNKQKK